MERNPVIAAEAASDLKGDISKICASLCFFVPISYALSTLLGKILSAATGLKGSELALAINSGKLYWIHTLIASPIPLLCCLIFLRFLLKHKLSITSLKPSADRKSFAFFTTAGLLSIPISYFVSMLTTLFFQRLNLPLSQSNMPSDSVGIIVFFVSCVIFAPLFEETIFRVIILERLRRYGDVFAIVTSAAFFSLLHSSFQVLPYSFVSGLILGFVAVKTGSALSSMIIHAANNLISCISILLMQFGSQNLGTSFLYGAFGIIIIFAISAIIFRDKNIKFFDFEYKGREISTARKLGIVLSSFFPATFYLFTFISAYFHLILL